MNEKQLERIYKKSGVINGILIVMLPLRKSAYVATKDGVKYILINSRLPHRRKRKLIKWGMKKLSR